MVEKQRTDTVVIYTDGACSGNPGPGGWGAIISDGELQKEISGAVLVTTNQQMELQAAVAALESLGNQPRKVLLYSDSAYLVNCFRDRWFARWERNGWMNAKKEPVQNKELWQKLLKLARLHQVEFRKVKAHAGDYYNERADQLARNALKNGLPR